MIARAERLLDLGVEPSRILLVSFSRAARDEIIRRWSSIGLSSVATERIAWTYHSLGLHILMKERPFEIDERRPLAGQGLLEKALGAAVRACRVLSRPEMRAAISISKRRLIGSQEAATSPEAFSQASTYGVAHASLADGYLAYQRVLRSEGKLDFDDMVTEAALLLRSAGALGRWAGRWRHVMVDESQDTSHAQQLLVRLIASRAESLVWVGDDNQSIYGFSGADPDALAGSVFDRRYSLVRNYRSTEQIVSVLTAAAVRRVAMTSAVGDGPAIVTACLGTPREEAAFVARTICECAAPRTGILVRTNAQKLEIELALADAGIRHRSPGLSFHHRPEVRIAMAVVAMTLSPTAWEFSERARVNPCPCPGCGSHAHGSRPAYFGLFDSVVRRPWDPRGWRHEDWIRALVGIGREIDAADLSKEPLLPLLVRTRVLQWAIDGQAPDECSDRLETLSRLSDVLLEIGPVKLLARHREALCHADRHTPARVELSTIHSAKGREWPRVFLCGNTEHVLPHRRGDPREERNVRYVGLSRAESLLYVTGYSPHSEFLLSLHGRRDG